MNLRKYYIAQTRLAHILGQRGSPTLENLCIFYLTSVQNLAGFCSVQVYGEILKLFFTLEN